MASIEHILKDRFGLPNFRPGQREAIEGLIAVLDRENPIPMDARAYKFDMILRGRRSTLFENRMEGN